MSIHCQIRVRSISQTGTFGHFLIISESLVTHKNFVQGLGDIYLLWYVLVGPTPLRCLSISLFIRAIVWVKLIIHVQFWHLNCFCNPTYHLPFGRTISHLWNIINTFLVNGKKRLNIYPQNIFRWIHTWKFIQLSPTKIFEGRYIWSNLNATAIKAINVDINCNNEINFEL